MTENQEVVAEGSVEVAEAVEKVTVDAPVSSDVQEEELQFADSSDDDDEDWIGEDEEDENNVDGY